MLGIKRFATCFAGREKKFFPRWTTRSLRHSTPSRQKTTTTTTFRNIQRKTVYTEKTEQIFRLDGRWTLKRSALLCAGSLDLLFLARSPSNPKGDADRPWNPLVPLRSRTRFHLTTTNILYECAGRAAAQELTVTTRSSAGSGKIDLAQK